MKPDNQLCKQCGKDISDRRKSAEFCSAKCKMAFRRGVTVTESVTKEPVSVTNVTVTEPNDSYRNTLTKSDKTFYDRNDTIVGKDYYRFNGPLRKEDCLHCGKPFQTNMQLLKFCSYPHYKQALAGRK